jgi:hypothetical protein
MERFFIGDRFNCEVTKKDKSFLERLWDRIKDAAQKCFDRIKRWWAGCNDAICFIINSKWNFECYDAQGNLKWAEYNRPNIMTDQGINFILDVMFHSTSNVAKWYIALVESNTSPAAGMTYAVPVYTECTAYTGGARPEFNEAAASAKSITNIANKASYTMSDTKTLYGGALVGGGTGADTAEIPGNTADATGILMCYSLFSTSKSVESTDIFKCWCTITGADA